MGRKILAVIVAMITATGIILIVAMVATRLWSTPNNLEYMSRAEASTYFSSRPLESYVVMLIGYVMGAFFAGFIVTKMSRRESPGKTLPVVVGVLLLLGMLATVALLPGQPIWFVIASLVAFIPFSLLGHRFAR